jgi:hypothetical protein
MCNKLAGAIPRHPDRGAKEADGANPIAEPAANRRASEKDRGALGSKTS